MTTTTTALLSPSPRCTVTAAPSETRFPGPVRGEDEANRADFNCPPRTPAHRALPRPLPACSWVQRVNSPRCAEMNWCSFLFPWGRQTAHAGLSGGATLVPGRAPRWAGWRAGSGHAHHVARVWGSGSHLPWGPQMLWMRPRQSSAATWATWRGGGHAALGRLCRLVGGYCVQDGQLHIVRVLLPCVAATPRHHRRCL